MSGPARKTGRSRLSVDLAPVPEHDLDDITPIRPPHTFAGSSATVDNDSRPSSAKDDIRAASQQSLLRNRDGAVTPENRYLRTTSQTSLMADTSYDSSPFSNKKGVRSMSGNSISSNMDYEKGGSHVPAQSCAAELWTPWWLSLPAFAIIGGIMTAIFVITHALYFAVRNAGGFDSNNSTYRILWTYLPIILYVLIAIYWARMEYWTKQLMPWKQLSRGLAPAYKTTLADYLSPWRIGLTLMAGFRSGHWPVVFVVINSILLKILIIGWCNPLILVLNVESQTASYLVKPASLIIAQICIPLFVIFAVALWFTRPVRATPRDLSTPGALALVMASSISFTNTMQGRTGMDQKKFQRGLKNASFGTVVEKSAYGHNFFRITVSASSEEAGKSLMAGSETVPKLFWLPMPDLYRLVVPALAVVMIFVVEGLNQRARGADGLAKGTDLWMQYGYAYWPGALCVVLAILFGIIDFWVRLLQPYSTMSDVQQTAEKSVMLNYLAMTPAKALWSSLRRRDFATIVSSMVMLLAPLTIVASSGLFMPVLTGIARDVPLQVLNNFGARPAFVADAAALKINSAVAVLSNESWPAGTHDSYVFQQLNISAGDLPKDNSTLPDQIVRARIPVMFAELGCNTISSDAIKLWKSIPRITNGTNSTTPSNVTLTANSSVPGNVSLAIAKRSWKRAEVASNVTYNIAIPVPAGCGSPCINNTDINTCNGTTEYYYLTNITKLIGSEVFARMFIAKPDPQPSGWSAKCPNFAAFYGPSIDDTRFVSKATFMTCSPVVRSADADAVFSLPNLTYNSSTLVNDSTILKADGDAATIEIEQFLPNATDDSNSLKNADIDSAFAAILTGRISLPITYLTDSSQSNTVIDGLQKTYARVMAQNMNLNMIAVNSSNSSLAKRATSSQDSSGTNTITGTLLQPLNIKMTQNTTPTRILEASFAIIFLCLCLTIAKLDIRRLLPHNPLTIAAQAALIADSELVKRELVPAGSEWCDDQTLKRTAMFDGLFFSLGVWGRGDRGDRGSIFGGGPPFGAVAGRPGSAGGPPPYSTGNSPPGSNSDLMSGGAGVLPPFAAKLAGGSGGPPPGVASSSSSSGGGPPFGGKPGAGGGGPPSGKGGPPGGPPGGGGPPFGGKPGGGPPGGGPPWGKPGMQMMEGPQGIYGIGVGQADQL